ncbi:hypothetical protein D3C87_795900 [compost metagenome]
MSDAQYLRKASLLLVEGDEALDLSALQFVFATKQADEESPNNCTVRVFNLSEDTSNRCRGEYSRVVLQAGYVDGGAGVIFEGTVKQYRVGRNPEGLTTFLDILAADGDTAYNFSVVNRTMAAGTTAAERLRASVEAMSAEGVKPGEINMPGTGGVLPRGKVLFGLARAAIRGEAATAGSTWNISNGLVNVTPLDGYLPSEAVVLTASTGLVGRVEQTEDGMRCRCLLNPRLVVGALVKIDNRLINQTVAAPGSEIPGGQVPYNRWAGVQQFATLANDGLYRIYVAEHSGDTRGAEYYTDLICLAVDPVTMKVKPYG